MNEDLLDIIIGTNVRGDIGYSLGGRFGKSNEIFSKSYKSHLKGKYRRVLPKNDSKYENLEYKRN